jgi:hypothetical protein
MASNSRLKSAIECVADFPDDHLEVGDEVVRASGMSLSRAIADLLAESGVSASIPTLDREHDSWEFYAEWSGRRFWILVSDMGATKLIQTEDASPIFRRFFSGQAAYAEFLELLYRELSNDARFRSVEWVA